MLTTADAKYIISEIRNIPYYTEKVRECTERLEELEDELLSSSAPVSPNGGIDVQVGSKIVRIKLQGHGETSAEKITRISVAKDMVEDRMKEFLRLQRRATAYYNVLLMDEETKEFTTAFFDNERYDNLASNYAIGNPYRHMVNIIKANIRRI